MTAKLSEVLRALQPLIASYQGGNEDVIQYYEIKLVEKEKENEGMAKEMEKM